MEGYRSISNNDNNYKQVIDQGTDDELLIIGYRQNGCKLFLCNITILLTIGVMQLLFHWKPIWKLNLTCEQCSLIDATVILIKDYHNEMSVAFVKEENIESFHPVELSSSFLDGQELFSPERNILLPGHKKRYFDYHCLKYYWDSFNKIFIRLIGYDDNITCSDIHDKLGGLTQTESNKKSQLYGLNQIDIKVKSYGSLFIDEVLNPFYIFQLASITLWSLDNYIYYACCIFIISIISISISLYETRKQLITLKEMVSHSNSLSVTVQRLGKEEHENIPASDLVPGDLIIIPTNGCLMSCDAVLTAGNCIVNEAMLTGESVPETKTPLPKHGDSEIYNTMEHKKHTLFCGTQVIQTRYYGNSLVTAVVVRTGFCTSKGQLVKSILFPKPMGFQFYKDSMRFVLFLFCIAAMGMAYSLYLYISRGSSVGETIKKVLDIITIVVPPALPAALTVGTVYAQSRLKAKGVFCISPPRINVAGKLKLMCFDKTGTLTEEGLDLFGIVPSGKGHFQSVTPNPCDLPQKSKILATMATCHSLTLIDGELCGDPMDLKMFLATNWDLEEPGKDTNRFDMLMPTVVRPKLNASQIKTTLRSTSQEIYPVPNSFNDNIPDLNENGLIPISEEFNYEIGIVKQFSFSSSLQRMSVICRTLGAKQMDLYVKGAPEKIQSLCIPNTIPDNFDDVLKDYTLQGFRVLALAYKQLSHKLHWHQAQRVKRDVIETDLSFLGLLIMQNSLKEETTPVIQTLRNASIRMVMITGDNILTALSVARDCSMIPSTSKVLLVKAVENDGHSNVTYELAEHFQQSNKAIITDNRGLYQSIDIELQREIHFAIDGKSFAVLRDDFPNLLQKLIVKGTVFARMTPDQKTHLVELLQSIGYVVGMCGDGANDCGALKAADIGISLSEAEASVAAPFTSRIQNIECVPIVMIEGRGALVTSFSLFKFIALYSIIQFISVLILYRNGSNLGDPMFLYIDLAVITSLAIVLGSTKSYPKLVAKRPLSNLMNISNLASMLLQCFIVTIFQLIAIIMLSTQSWYHPNEIIVDELVILCWESTTIFLVSSYQYIIVAVVFSKGPPYRKPLYTNWYYLLTLLVLYSFNTLLVFSPFQKLGQFFQLMDWQPNKQFNFRLTIFLMCHINWVLSGAAELFIAQSDWLRKLSRFIRRKKVPKNMYKNIQLDDIELEDTVTQ